MPHLFIFGLGYTSAHLASRLRREGWTVAGTRRTAAGDAVSFDDDAAVRSGVASATHILSSVPPVDGRDPVLERHGAAIIRAPALWCGYLSSTGVYGDTAGAWVDEGAAIGSGRRTARAEADMRWQALRPDARIFRLPGIYGPGRSVLERIEAGAAHRIDSPGQVFSRIHVDDLVSGVLASLKRGSAGVYNLADDLPAPQNAVVEYGCALLGRALPPLLAPDEAGLSPAALGFYAERRRIANGRAKRLLGWSPRYPDYRAGLRALSATTRPSSTSSPPTAASADHR